jgi:hypothetical protein
MDEPENVLKLWQEQDTTAFHMTADEVRRRMEEMDRKHRRTLYDSYAAFALISLVIIALAAVSPNFLMRLGAVLSILGLGFLTFHIRRQLHPVDGMPAPTVEAYRDDLRRQLEFTRKGLWARVLCITPGPLLFSLGFAAAYPKAAPIIYVQLATFAVAIMAIVPVTRRKAARVQRELDEVVGLEVDRAR